LRNRPHAPFKIFAALVRAIAHDPMVCSGSRQVGIDAALRRVAGERTPKRASGGMILAAHFRLAALPPHVAWKHGLFNPPAIGARHQR